MLHLASENLKGHSTAQSPLAAVWQPQNLTARHEGCQPCPECFQIARAAAILLDPMIMRDRMHGGGLCLQLPIGAAQRGE